MEFIFTAHSFNSLILTLLKAFLFLKRRSINPFRLLCVNSLIYCPPGKRAAANEAILFTSEQPFSDLKAIFSISEVPFSACEYHDLPSERPFCCNEAIHSSSEVPFCTSEHHHCSSERPFCCNEGILSTSEGPLCTSEHQISLRNYLFLVAKLFFLLPKDLFVPPNTKLVFGSTFKW